MIKFTEIHSSVGRIANVGEDVNSFLDSANHPRVLDYKYSTSQDQRNKELVGSVVLMYEDGEPVPGHVQMTNEQYNLVEEYKANHSSDLEGLSDLTLNNKSRSRGLDILDSSLWGHPFGEATFGTFNKTLTALLHPELIDIVD